MFVVQGLLETETCHEFTLARVSYTNTIKSALPGNVLGETYKSLLDLL